MKKGWLLILVAAAAAGGAACYYWQSQARAGRLDIQTAEIKRSDVRRVVSTSGTVRALVTVDIGSQLSGNIGEVNVDYSTEVRKDEVLARLEPSSFETRVREGEAGVAVARANVDLQLASVQRAEANLRKAGLDLGRAKELVLKGATSQAALDTAVAAEEGARADLAIAKANVENAISTAPTSARRSTAWSSTRSSRSGRPWPRACKRRSCSPSPRTSIMCRSRRRSMRPISVR
jgi:HlyD family secretion protein